LEVGRCRVILATVIHIFVRDELVDSSGPYIRAEALHSVGRMNGPGNYVRIRDFFQLERERYEDWQKKRK
jgi:hypothetical protein